MTEEEINKFTTNLVKEEEFIPEVTIDKIYFRNLSGFLKFVIIGSFAGIVLDGLYFLLGFLIGLMGI